jgi:hypothetical protein
MASPARHRVDDYGYPRPEVTDARKELIKDKPQNQEQRDLMRRLLESVYQSVLRRGWYGTVTIEFQVEDGLIQQDVIEHTRRKRRSL